MIDDRGLATRIEVDGGIDGKNILEVIEAGVDIAVAGSAVYGKGMATESVRDLIEKGTVWV